MFFEKHKEKLLIASAVVYLGLFYIPKLFQYPNPDSGIYLYIAQRVLDGLVPYKDAWDNKGIVIFLWNALGLAFGRSIIGVLILEFGFILLSTILIYRTTKKVWGVLAAAIGAGAFLYCFTLLSYGTCNTAENFILCIMIIAIYIYFSTLNKSNYIWQGLLLGLCLGIVFYTKMSIIGLWLSMFIGWLIQTITGGNIKSILGRGLGVFIGFSIFSLGILGYLQYHGALHDFYDAYFVYNFNYSQYGSYAERFKSFRTGQQLLFPFIQIAIISGIFNIISALKYKKYTVVILVSVVTIDIFIEMLATSSTGKYPVNYYMVWLPAMSILLSNFAFMLQSFFKYENPLKDEFNLKILLLLIFTCLAFAPAVHFIAKDYLLLLNHEGRLNMRTKGIAIIDFLQSKSEKNDYVLPIGLPASILFQADRKTPSRFFTQYSWDWTSKKQKEQFTRIFLEEVKAHPPKFVILEEPHVYWDLRPLTLESIKVTGKKYKKLDIADFDVWERLE